MSDNSGGPFFEKNSWEYQPTIFEYKPEDLDRYN